MSWSDDDEHVTTDEDVVIVTDDNVEFLDDEFPFTLTYEIFKTSYCHYLLES